MMFKRSMLFLMLAFVVTGCSTFTSMPPEQRAEQVLSSALNVFQSFKASPQKPMERFRALWPQAQGVVILPGLLKGGFIVAAEGGNGIMLAKDSSGRWGQPGFYFMAAGSVGLQIGGQASDVVLLIFSQKAVESIIRHQGKLGADLGLTFGTIGAGIEASTTTNVGTDILAFSEGIGAFAGGSLEAAALIKRNDLNEVFYGQPATPREIIVQGLVQNPASDALRAALNAP